MIEEKEKSRMIPGSLSSVTNHIAASLIGAGTIKGVEEWGKKTAIQVLGKGRRIQPSDFSVAFYIQYYSLLVSGLQHSG